MHLIAVDIGNSSTKIGVPSDGRDGTWSFRQRIEHDQAWAPSLPEKNLSWIVCSVNDDRFHCIHEWTARHRPNDQLRKLDYSDTGLLFNVERPDQVGMDRLTAAVAAAEMVDRQENVIVVDAGTAVTIDLVADGNRFMGGAIFPGTEVGFKSLAQGTSQLPELFSATQSIDRIGVPENVIGQDTADAIRSGVFYAQIGAIKEIVRNIAESAGKNTAVVLTGGGIQPLLDQLPRTWTYVEDLVLLGIVSIARRTAH